MLDVLVKSAVRRKVVAFFALNSSGEFYPRQVAQELEESPHAVGLEIKYLVKSGVLQTVQTASGIYYKWNHQYPFADVLKSVVAEMKRCHNVEMGEIPDMEWRQYLAQAIDSITDAIVKNYQPEKIILFGSAATGKAGPDSDIDMLIVKRTALKPLERLRQIAPMLPRQYDVAIDCVVWTPEELAADRQSNLFLKHEILKKGKVLYERKSPTLAGLRQR